MMLATLAETMRLGSPAADRPTRRLRHPLHGRLKVRESPQRMAETFSLRMYIFSQKNLVSPVLWLRTPVDLTLADWKFTVF